MSRYVFINTTFGVCPGPIGSGAYRQINIGETIADVAGNALANGNGPGSPPDIVAPNYTTAPDPNFLCPLPERSVSTMLRGRCRSTSSGRDGAAQSSSARAEFTQHFYVIGRY